MPDLVSIEVITSKIFVIRGKKVMLDRDLAQLYEVTTKRLKRTSKTKYEEISRRFYVSVNQA